MSGANEAASRSEDFANEPKISSRGDSVKPFIVMDVMNAAAQIEHRGGSVVHMEVGQPSAATPLHIRQAASRALEHGAIGYTQALGLDSLRRRIARHYLDCYGVTVDAGRIAVTTGSSAAFILTFLACFEPGARVAITAPGYPAYRNILLSLGLEPVVIQVGGDTGHMLTADHIAKAHAEKALAGVLVMSPANPTGIVMPPATIADLGQVCRRLGLWFISDEIYHGLTYGPPATTALMTEPDAIVINSFSKYYCMTGWRVGWLVAPNRLMRAIERLQQNLSISVPYLSQVAAEAAFDATEECEAIKNGYAENRAFLTAALPAIGLDSFLPVDGAFYIYADIGRLTNDSMSFCNDILQQAGVAITPGLDFDSARGNRTVRLSFAGSQQDCREAVLRLDRFLQSRNR